MRIECIERKYTVKQLCQAKVEVTQVEPPLGSR